MTFPPTLDATFTATKTDSTTAAGDHAPTHNTARDAIQSILTELGSAPHGSAADLTVRLAALDTSVAANGTSISANGTSIAALQHPTINAQTGTTYTFVLTDDGKIVTFNNAAAITASIPTDASVAFPVGTVIQVAWVTGAGQPTVNAVTSGTTTVASTGATATAPKLRVKNSGASLIKVAANSWLVLGDLA